MEVLVTSPVLITVISVRKPIPGSVPLFWDTQDRALGEGAARVPSWSLESGLWLVAFPVDQQAAIRLS